MVRCPTIWVGGASAQPTNTLTNIYSTVGSWQRMIPPQSAQCGQPPKRRQWATKHRNLCKGERAGTQYGGQWAALYLCGTGRRDTGGSRLPHPHHRGGRQGGGRNKTKAVGGGVDREGRGAEAGSVVAGAEGATPVAQLVVRRGVEHLPRALRPDPPRRAAVVDVPHELWHQRLEGGG